MHPEEILSIYISTALIMQIAHRFVHQDISILFALFPAPSQRSVCIVSAGMAGRFAGAGLEFQSSLSCCMHSCFKSKACF